MQTFVPYTSFTECAKVLDRQRLGKQRVEVLQILRALRGISSGWINHPAVKMWRGYEYSLGEYGLEICKQWISLGYKDTCTEKIKTLQGTTFTTKPIWWGNCEIHSSHRAALLAKKLDHYSNFGWEETPKIDYIWPI
jgi:hypothetical protein